MRRAGCEVFEETEKTETYILSRGRVALLGIAQRQMRVSRVHIPAVWNRRKSLPTCIQTLGDLIQIKRYEKRLTVGQLAEKMGIAQTTIRAWERDGCEPDPQRLEALGEILGLSIRVGPINSK
jgi:ribosome-binding protein aMBF1 (putative translation factor)